LDLRRCASIGAQAQGKAGSGPRGNAATRPPNAPQPAHSRSMQARYSGIPMQTLKGNVTPSAIGR